MEMEKIVNNLDNKIDKQLNLYKRKLVTFNESYTFIAGYINALTELGIYTEEEEKEILKSVTEELLEISKSR